MVYELHFILAGEEARRGPNAVLEYIKFEHSITALRPLLEPYTAKMKSSTFTEGFPELFHMKCK